MIFFPTTAAYTSEIAPADRRGEYMGYYQMTFSFAFQPVPGWEQLFIKTMAL